MTKHTHSYAEECTHQGEHLGHLPEAFHPGLLKLLDSTVILCNFAVGRYSFLGDTNVLANAFGKGKAEILLSTRFAVALFLLLFLFFFASIALLAEIANPPKEENLKHLSRS